MLGWCRELHANLWAAKVQHDRMTEDLLLKVAEVARVLRISTSKLYREQRTGALRVLRFGRAIRVRKSEVHRYLRKASGTMTSEQMD
jgi:excisionase family DNA binding protein